jgi:hypothetical protein
MGLPHSCQRHPHKTGRRRISRNSLIIQLNIIGVIVELSNTRTIVVEIDVSRDS